MKNNVWRVALLFLFIQPAGAALNFVLTPAVQSGALGTEITFSGTLTNTSATDALFLNDIHFNFSGASGNALAPDSNAFFSNVPGILLPNEVYTGPIFTVVISSSAAASDYSGSVTIRGGADIFATADLQTQNVEVSSPMVTISATTPDAYEFGPVAGVFTVTRSGNVDYDLVVKYAVTGSANNGRFDALSGSVTLANGSASGVINVTPVPNNNADGMQTVVLTISPNASYNVGGLNSDTVTIHDKPIDEWRLAHFGANANTPAIAGDGADPDQDGLSNLLEYGLFSDPNVTTTSDAPAPAISGNHLQLIFHRNTSATDVTYTVEGTSDSALGSWSPVMTRAPGGGWVANMPGAVAMESDSGDYVSVVITDSVPVVDPDTLQPAPRRFLRLRLVR